MAAPSPEINFARCIETIVNDANVHPITYLRIRELVNEMGLDWRSAFASLRLGFENGLQWNFTDVQNQDIVYRGVDVAHVGRDEYEIFRKALDTIDLAPSPVFDELNVFISHVVQAARGRGVPAMRRETLRRFVTTALESLNQTRHHLDTLIHSYRAIHNSGPGYIQRCQEVYKQVLDIVFTMYGLPKFEPTDQAVWDQMAHCAAVSGYFKEANCELVSWAESVHKTMTSIACVLYIRIPGFTHARRLQDQMEPRRFWDLVEPLTVILNKQIGEFKKADIRMFKKQHLMDNMIPRCVALQALRDCYFAHIFATARCRHGQGCPAYTNWEQGHH